MIRSEWKVTCNRIDGVKVWAVYRLLDVNEVDHSGNREYATKYMADKAKAEEIARELNAGEKGVN